MYCPECGAEVGEAARFCAECGELIPSGEATDAVDVDGDGDATETESTGGLAAKLPGINATNTRRRNVVVGSAYALAGCTGLVAAIPSESEENNGDGRTTPTEPDPETDLKQRAQNGYDDGGFGEELREVEVLGHVDGGHSVNTRYDLSLPGDEDDDEFNANVMAIEINRRLYESSHNVMQTGTFAYVTVQDQYGEQSDDILHKVTIERETAEQINWENILPKNIPEVADGYLFNRSLY